MRKEEWRIVPNFENYMVSNLGRVKSLNYRRTGKEKILSLTTKDDGHTQAPLFKNGKCYRKYVHQLMALAFIPIPEKYKGIPVEDLVVHHIDFSMNNVLENLCWLTKEEHDEIHSNKKKEKLPSILIEQRSLDNRLIKVWSSLTEIERETGWSHTNIGRCCKQRYGFKTAYGCIWKYKSL